jgi:nitroimidazol reductase NimA-like FMN-containing flavoprotein (pyridoxamine 5'-phosphate oxidase superfamily)
VGKASSDVQGPFNQIRRQDRAQDDTWIKAYLHRAPFGSLATVLEGQPFIVARNFVYDEDAHAIYLHGATKGRTYLNVMSYGRVCFSASEMGRLLTAKKAINFGVEYSGVVVFGRAAIVTDPAEARHGLQLLMDKYFPRLKPGRDYEPITEGDLKITAVIRVDIESWSGKQKSA